MQDMQQVPHLIIEYTWVLVNITLPQTKVFIMTKDLVFVLKQSFRRQCSTFQIFTLLKIKTKWSSATHTLKSQEDTRPLAWQWSDT